MNVLVAFASSHGSTRDIAEAIGDELRAGGIAADVRDVADVIDLGMYDAAVLGSAVYMGRWLPPALRFAHGNLTALRSLPVWLFSSGPLGDPLLPPGEPKGIDDLARKLGAREHRVFAGRLEPATLTRCERLVVKLVHAPSGDHRPWEAIRAWTGSIAVALRQVAEEAEAAPIAPR